MSASRDGLAALDLVSILAVLVLPAAVVMRQPFWALPSPGALGAVAIALVLSLALLAARAVASSPRRQAAAAVVVLASAAVVAWLVLRAAGVSAFGPPAPVALGLSVLLLVLRALVTTRAARSIVAAGLIVVTAASLVVFRTNGTAGPPSSTTDNGASRLSVHDAAAWARGVQVGASDPRTIFSAYYTLDLATYPGVADPLDVHEGGALARLDDDVLAMTGSGAIYAISRAGESGAVVSRRLPVPSPLDLARFAAEAPPEADRDWFRAHDLLARRTSAGWQLFVSHHVWNRDEQCVAVVISTATLDRTLDTVVEDWSVVARLHPCLPVGGAVRGVAFAGHEAGGRMSWYAADVLLLTTGDHQFDGVNRPVAAAQDEAYDYGKTLLVDVATGAIQRFTSGHRNPEGLYIAPDGRIWSTEHGPRGGDELNLLVRGGDYGWPYETFGTEYNVLSWPAADRAPQRAATVAPRFAWVPSIGVSNLIGVEGDAFPRWKGNLLVAALGMQTVYRVALDDDRVEYVEPIAVRRRIRDVVEAPGGGLWLWTDEGDLLALEPARTDDRGAALFTACAGCHTIDSDGRSGGLGPNLFGVVGRPVASNPTYAGYTTALRSAGGAWTRDRLDAFLADPDAFAPGTAMTTRVDDAADRAAIVDFLERRR